MNIKNGLLFILALLLIVAFNYRFTEIEAQTIDIDDISYKNRQQIDFNVDTTFSLLNRGFEVEVNEEVHEFKKNNFNLTVDTEDDEVIVKIRAINYLGMKTKWKLISLNAANKYQSTDTVTNISIRDNLIWFTGSTVIPGFERTGDYFIDYQIKENDDVIYSSYTVPLNISNVNNDLNTYDFSFPIDISLLNNLNGQPFNVNIEIIDQDNNVVHQQNITDYSGIVKYYVQNDKLYSVKDVGDNVLIADVDEFIEVTDIYYYGEMAHFNGLYHQEDETSGINNIAMNLNGITEMTFTNKKNITNSLFLPNLEIGSTFLTSGTDREIPIVSFNDINEHFYTITRDNKNKLIDITVEDYIVTFDVKYDELPTDVYDFVIDAGHGEYDDGACITDTTICEKYLNTEIATYMSNQLSDLGYKVYLYNEAINEPNHTIRPYVENGRIETIYDVNAKYVISNHFNSSDSGNYSGYEVYTSYYSDNDWGKLVSQSLRELNATSNVGIAPSNRQTGSTDFEGVYNVLQICEDQPTDGEWCTLNPRDNYYIIREAGGEATGAYRIKELNGNVTDDDLKYGKEVILVEYLYLNNSNDYRLIYNNNAVDLAYCKAMVDEIINATQKYIDPNDI